MKPSSAKAKGRIFQQWVRDQILATYPQLEPDDCRSTSMGAGGEDVQLSPACRKLFPFTIECKSNAAFAGYKFYEQAQEHEKTTGATPIVFIKANNKKPLVMMDAEHFFELQKGTTT